MAPGPAPPRSRRAPARKPARLCRAADAKEGIVGVQTMRNMVIAIGLLMAAEASIISVLITTLTDKERLAQLQVSA